jgi:hypothetical protein
LDSTDFWWLFDWRDDKLEGTLQISMIQLMPPMANDQSSDPVLREDKEECRLIGNINYLKSHGQLPAIAGNHEPK